MVRLFKPKKVNYKRHAIIDIFTFLFGSFLLVLSLTEQADEDGMSDQLWFIGLVVFIIGILFVAWDITNYINFKEMEK